MSLITFTKLGRYGRAGNQMFQVASTIGIAVKHGYEYAFPYWQNWDHRFPPEPTITPSDEDIDMQSYFKNSLPLLQPSLGGLIEKEVPWGYHDLVLPSGNWDLRGHMQSEKYFAHCRPLIKHYFEWSEKTIKSAKYHLFSIRSFFYGVENFACIQFRRGDYVPKAGYHPVIGADYYKRAIAMLPAGTKLIVFPEHNEAEAREMIGDEAYYVDTNIHYMTRMYMASLCSHFILPNSTYMWFPAWLCDNPGKIVTVPAGWFGPEAEGLPANDIIAEGWRVI